MDEPAEETKKEKEIERVEENAQALSERGNKQIPYNFGLCNKCSKFFFVEYEGYGNFKAYCQMNYDNLMKRNISERVTSCNNFWDISYKSVREMIEIATWVTPKKKVGFCSE